MVWPPSGPPSVALSGRSRPSFPTSPNESGITIGVFDGCPGVAGTTCTAAFEDESLACRIKAPAHRHLRSAGLTVPPHKLRHVTSARVRKALDELLDRRGLAVVASKVKIHADMKFFLADQGLHHAHQFGALFVDGGRVEVVDLPICLRTDGMCERSGVFGELCTAKCTNIGNTLDGPGTHIGGKFLIAKYGAKSFLQAKLKPVAAR